MNSWANTMCDIDVTPKGNLKNLKNSVIVLDERGINLIGKVYFIISQKVGMMILK